MKKLLLTGWLGLASLFLPLAVHAQTYNWAMKVGNDGADQALAVTRDASNNIFVGGFFIKTAAGTAAVNFNPLGTATNLNSTTGGDAYIAKYGSDGVLVKAYKWFSTLDDKVNDICVDPSGNVLVTGYGKGSVSTDPAFAAPALACGSGGGIVVLK